MNVNKILKDRIRRKESYQKNRDKELQKSKDKYYKNKEKKKNEKEKECLTGK